MKYRTLSIALLFAVVLTSCGGRPDRTHKAAGPHLSGQANNAAASTSKEPNKSLPKIVAFGDSLTAGYGLNPEDAYTTLLQKKLDEDGFRFQVVNAGVSGDTSADGLGRIDWALSGDVKIVILELGANDLLRDQSVELMKKNLAEIIDRAKAKGARVLLAGMEAPTNNPPEYRQQAHRAYLDLAKEKHADLIPFVLDGVAGTSSLNQSDGIHPNVEGEKIMTDNVYKYLGPMLQKQ